MNAAISAAGKGVTSAGLDVVGLVRATRRRADTSQRELATEAGVAASTVGRIESGSLVPSLAVLGSILRVAGVRLVAVGSDGRAILPMADAPDHNLRDGAGRRYPSHLDTIIDPTGAEWWGGRYGLAGPPETFLRDRERRDVQRRRSVYEVRVTAPWSGPPPPTVEFWRLQQQRRAQREELARRFAVPRPPASTRPAESASGAR